MYEKKKKPGFDGKRHRGIITVFVVLIMVPTVVITGTMVDVARLKTFQTQAAIASDSYGEAVLSEYDNVLKELYGLFAVTQSEEGKKAIEELAQYANASFHPNGEGVSVTGSMLFDSADTSIDYSVIENSSLANENIFMTQVADFMEFREVGQLLNNNDLFEKLEQFQNIQGDSEAVRAVAALGDTSTALLKELSKYWENLRVIKQYEDYHKDLNSYLKNYSELMKTTVIGAEYEEYYNYLNAPDKDAIDAAHAKQEKINNGQAEDGETMSKEEEELAKKWVDAEAFNEALSTELEGTSMVCWEWHSEPIDFYNFEDCLRRMKVSAVKIECYIENIVQKKQELDNKLANCSPELKKSIEDEVKDLETIVSFKGKFIKLYENEETYNVPNNTNNKKVIENVLQNGLDPVKEKLTAGELQPADTTWVSSWLQVWNQWNWLNVPTGEGKLYTELEAMYNQKDGSGEQAASAAEDKIDYANSRQQEALESLNAEEETAARDIPADVMSQLGAVEVSGEIPSAFSYLKKGLDFSDFTNIGTAAFDKFLLTEYDFGMFSSRVTGVPQKDDDSSEESQQESKEYSLTKVEKSRDINYLYGAELEYIFGGRSSSKDNLAITRNVICGARMMMNTFSTYSVKEVNKAIKHIANLAAEAVTAGTAGLGAAAAPLVRIAVSTALRQAVSSFETVADWTALKNREDVVFWKRKLEELKSYDIVKEFLGGSNLLESAENSEESSAFELSYEDYLHVLLFVSIDKGTLVRRSSELVTLNVNHSQNREDTLKAPLSFMPDKAYTAVKSTCKAKLEMVIVPDYMMQMFLNGNKTQEKIGMMDDDYAYYSVIRSY